MGHLRSHSNFWYIGILYFDDIMTHNFHKKCVWRILIKKTKSDIYVLVLVFKVCCHERFAKRPSPWLLTWILKLVLCAWHLPFATFGQIWNNYHLYYLFHTTNKHWIKPGNSCPHLHHVLKYISEKTHGNTPPLFMLICIADGLNYWKMRFENIVKWNKNCGHLYHNISKVFTDLIIN